MKGVWVALCVCTRFGGLLTQVPGQIRIHIREELRQWWLGSFLCLRQSIHNLHRCGELNIWGETSRSQDFEAQQTTYLNLGPQHCDEEQDHHLPA